MLFKYGEGRYKPEIKIEDLKNDSIEFRLLKADLSFANSLRRVIISEVPTMAIDMVEVVENTSPLFDEFVVHRLGLIPLKSEDIDNYQFPLKCSCKEGCPKCQVKFEIKIKCDKDTIDVTAEDIKSSNEECTVKPVKYDDPIVITKLKKGQSINMTLTAKKGIGKTHAKWSPVCTCVMRQVPDVKFPVGSGEVFWDKLTDEEKKSFCEACPSKVFKLVDEKITIDKPDKKCTYCEECMIKIQDFIKKKDKKKYQELVKEKGNVPENKGPSINYRELIEVQPKENEFVFKIETTGAMSPKKIVMEAFNILKQKFLEVDHILIEKMELEE